MKQKETQNLESGLDRIESIKNEIQSYTENPAYCKAEVFEMWDDVFEEDEEEDED